MASTLRTWIISTAAATGVLGGGAVGLAAAAPGHNATNTAAAQPAGIDTSALQAQVQQLLAEDQALHLALAEAKTRLSSQVAVSEASLRAVRAQLAAAQAALAAARRAAASTYATSGRHTAVAPRPSSHTTTGASGATSGTESGHDD